MGATKTIVVEAARSVADDFCGDFDDAAAFVPSENEFRSILKLDMTEAGIKPWRSRLFRLKPDSVEFVEFDSGNVSHAAAYYKAEFTGPAADVDKMERSRE